MGQTVLTRHHEQGAKPMLKTKLTSMEEAIAAIPDGAHVAIGGSLIRRHPMAAIHELIRQNKKNLTIYGWNNANDFDLLIGAGCVKEAHSSYVGFANAGQAHRFRKAVEAGRIRFVDHSETTAIDRFRAGASGIDFIPSKTALHSVLQKNEEYQKEIICPFTGERYVAMKAFKPDFAIVHMHRADKYGNVQLDPRRMMDNETDILIAKSANHVIVTVEQIVSEEAIVEEPTLTVLPRLFVDAVVEAPYGAYPTSCDTRYDYDFEHLLYYAEQSKSDDSFVRYLDEYVRDVGNWDGFLKKIGLQRLLKLTRRQGVN
jgi:glutaconate CoA-transferase subunit A